MSDSPSFDVARLTELVEALPVGVFILGADGNAIYANAAAEALLGRKIAEGDTAPRLGQRYKAYRAGTDELYPATAMPIVRALAAERCSIDDMEIDRNGERISLEVTATPILDHEQRVIFAVAVFQDITARKQAQRALAALNEELEREVARRTSELASTVAALEHEISTRRLYESELVEARDRAERASLAKSVFLMNVSHELRTPLHQIIGFNDLLADRLEDERGRRLAENAQSSGRDLLDKIDALIELARAETPQQPQPDAEFDLHAMVANVAAAFGVSCEFTKELGRVRGDETSARQVVADVCRAGAMEAPSVLVATKEESRLILEIRGSSLAKRVEALAEVFGDVPQRDAARYQQVPLDLRLAVARVHARRLGGDIVVMAPNTVEVSMSFAS